MTNFYIADTHFSHKNVIKFDNRPFSSIEEMNEKLISNWNSAVRNEDVVYILGDFIWSKPNSDDYKNIISRLNGWKVIILGNHDPKDFSKELRRIGRIRKICTMEEVKEPDGSIIICSHYPIPFYRRSHYEAIYHFCGHVHKTRENDFLNNIIDELIQSRKNKGDSYGNILNVGCMMNYMSYTPQPFLYLKQQIDERRKSLTS